MVDSKRFVGALLNALQIAFFATAGCLLLGGVMSLILVFIPFPRQRVDWSGRRYFYCAADLPDSLAFTFIYGSAGLLNGTLMSLFAFELPPVDFSLLDAGASFWRRSVFLRGDAY